MYSLMRYFVSINGVPHANRNTVRQAAVSQYLWKPFSINEFNFRLSGLRKDEERCYVSCATSSVTAICQHSNDANPSKERSIGATRLLFRGSSIFRAQMFLENLAWQHSSIRL